MNIKLAAVFVSMACIAGMVFAQNKSKVQDQSNDVEKLILKLSDNDPLARDEAKQQLIKLGQPVLELVKKAAQGKDEEVKKLATEIVDKIEFGKGYHKSEKFLEYLEECGINNLQFEAISKSISRKYLTDLKALKITRTDDAGNVTLYSYLVMKKFSSRINIVTSNDYSFINSLLSEETIFKNEEDITEFLDTVQEELFGSNDLIKSVDKTVQKAQMEDGTEKVLVQWSATYFSGNAFSFTTDVDGKVIK